MDRFFRGLVAGMIGAIPMNIWSYISFYIIGMTERRFVDWATILLLGSPPNNLFELIMGLITQVLWSGFLGIVFAYLIVKTTSQGYLIKGAFYGFITGFIIYAISILFQMPYLSETPANTAISQIIGGIMWGITMAYSLRWLDKRITY